MLLKNWRFIPFERHTIVSAYTASQVLDRLRAYTRQAKHPPDFLDIGLQKPHNNFLFNGLIGRSSFHLSQQTLHPNLFMPQLKGRIEETSSGCIIFLNCSLFFSTRLLLVTALLGTLLMAAIYIFYVNRYTPALFSLAFGLSFYLIAMVNYNMQKNISLSILHRTLA
jgi:hypothetical protein